MNKLLVSLMLVIGLSACASKGTFTSNGNDQRFAQDRANCRIAMNQNFPTNSIISAEIISQIANIKQQNEATDFFNDCMIAKGYSQNSANTQPQRSTPPVPMVSPTLPTPKTIPPTANNFRFICVPVGSGSGYKAKLVEDNSVWMVTKIIGVDRVYCEDNRFILKAESVAYVAK